MKLFALFLCLFLLSGCSSPEGSSETFAQEPQIPETAISETEHLSTVPPDPLRLMLNEMSLEERVGQLFLARCDDAVALSDLEQYHLGGFILFAQDFDGQTPDTLTAKLQSYQNSAKIPLLMAVDEEGGTVTRVSRYPAFRNCPFPSPRQAFEKDGLEGALALEEEKCLLLSGLGINVNMGPVCDISLEPEAFMYQRSMGQSPAVTARFVSDTVNLMAEHKVGSVLKHFPGYGNNPDTHTGIAIDNRSLEDLESFDLYPFTSGIGAGCGAILVSHTIVECLDDQFPASLSPAVHEYLRNTMGFTGVILTDDLVMEAITDQYGAGEAAVLAVLAGNDLLCSTDYPTQYEAVLAAVLAGRIDIDTLNNAVRNVLEWKMELGLM